MNRSLPYPTMVYESNIPVLPPPFAPPPTPSAPPPSALPEYQIPQLQLDEASLRRRRLLRRSHTKQLSFSELDKNVPVAYGVMAGIVWILSWIFK